MPKINSLFDLTNLIRISGDDQEFVRETIKMTIYSMPETIDQIDLSYVHEDLALLKKSIHCIKPTMIMFDHTEIRSLITKIESSEAYSEIKSSVIELQSLFQEFIESLKCEIR